MIEQTYGGPKITKDGVTVAKAMELKVRNDLPYQLGRGQGKTLWVHV
jgi:hypothetical protein